jgi:lauroyl/myristoyl acyltransferase
MYNYILYRIGQFLAMHLPLRLSYAVAVFVSDLRYLVARQDRILVKQNLKTIFPDKSESQIKQIRLSMFRNFAKYLVDFFRLAVIDKGFVEKRISIENMRYVDQALKEGKGAILLTAHIGNWELGGVAVALLGYPLWAVALEHNHAHVNRFFNGQRQSKGLKVIPFNKAVRQSLQVLRGNGLLALVGDRDFTREGGVIVDFLNKKASLPRGPAALCFKTNAPIIPGFIVRNADDSFTLHFEHPITAPTQDKQPLSDDQAIMWLLLKYKTLIEEYIRKYPDQWFMFRQYWPADTGKQVGV